MEALRPSLEEATPFMTQDDALSYIGSRGNSAGIAKKERIEFAKRILREDFLPHVSTGENCETTKSYFLGYMVYRLMQGFLGRSSEDDRDHYGKKRLDMAGSLLGALFHHKYREFKKKAHAII